MGLVTELPKVHRAEGISPTKALDALVTEFTVRTEAGSMRYMIDGELRVHDAPEMSIRIGRPVRIAT